MDRLLREDLPDDEDRRPLVSERARDVGIGRDVVRVPVDEDRHGGRAREAEGVELPAVEVAVRDAELRHRRERLQLLAPPGGVTLGVLVEAAEVARRRDVVVDHDLAVRERGHAVERVVPHRHVDEERGALGRLLLEVAPGPGQRAHLGLALLREELGPDAVVPHETLQLEAVVPDRVAIREGRVELRRAAKPHRRSFRRRPRQRICSPRS